MTAPDSPLYAAVIMQALYDYHMHLRGRRAHTGGVNEIEGREAELFLTAESGPWKRSRTDLCHCAGIDPEALRDRVLAAREADGDMRAMMPKRRAPADDARRVAS